MKTLILYFSGSGNTKYGAELVKRGLECSARNTCNLVPVSKYHPGMEESYDIVGFATPVYAFKPSLGMMEAIETLPNRRNQPCFTFLTYVGNGVNSAHTLQRSLKARGYTVIAHHEMPADNSWTTVRTPKFLPNFQGHPNAQEQQAVIDFGRSLETTLSEYLRGDNVEITHRFHWSPMDLISHLYSEPVLRRFFVTRVDPSKCTRCGICVQTCPTGRMRFEAFPNPKGHCNGCYACINACPSEAIEGWLTNGKIRYKGIPQELKIPESRP